MALIRAATAADAAAIAALIRMAFAGLPLDPPPSALQETADSVGRHLRDGGGAVSTSGTGAIVANVLWTEQDGGLYLHRLAVAQGWRRRGLAQALVGRVEAEARRRGLPRVHLGVRLALPGNRGLFAALGYKDVALHSHEGYGHPTWATAEKWLQRE